MFFVANGKGGIRTLDELSPIPLFESGAFNHSATFPAQQYYQRSARVSSGRIQLTADQSQAVAPDIRLLDEMKIEVYRHRMMHEYSEHCQSPEREFYKSRQFSHRRANKKNVVDAKRRPYTVHEHAAPHREVR